MFLQQQLRANQQQSAKDIVRSLEKVLPKQPPVSRASPTSAQPSGVAYQQLDSLGMLVDPTSTTPVSTPPGLSATISRPEGMGIEAEPVWATPTDVGTNPPIYSNTDTVGELLKGLATPMGERESLQRLSDETQDVLPTFAQAMLQLHMNSPNSAHNDVSALDTPTLQDLTSGGVAGVDPTGSTDSLLGFLAHADNSDLGLSITDSNMKYVMDNTDFTDMFSQLKDILRTPERPSRERLISAGQEVLPMATSSSPPRRDAVECSGSVWVWSCIVMFNAILYV